MRGRFLISETVPLLSLPLFNYLFRYYPAGYAAVHGLFSDAPVSLFFGNMLLLYQQAFGLIYDPHFRYLIFKSKYLLLRIPDLILYGA